MISVPFVTRFSQISHKTWRRLGTACLIVLLLHLFFLFVAAPRISWKHENQSKTEVVEINQKELNALKNQIKAALLKQELHEEYRTKEAPKDAKMIAPFNQKVPEQMTATSHAEDPSYGGGGAQAKPATPSTNIKLSNLGLGSSVPKPQTKEQPPSPVQGPPGPYHPRGLEDKQVKKGNQNLLDAAESEYYSFITRFEEPIVRNWYFLMRSYQSQIMHEMAQKNYHPGDEVYVTIEFMIDRKGNFRSIDVVEPSGIPTLDNATRDAIKKLGSIPNPPPGIFEGEPYFTRRMGFLVRLSDSPMVNSRPDVYW